ncbi:MAG: CoA transferase [Pusillimonas sp.]
MNNDSNNPPPSFWRDRQELKGALAGVRVVDLSRVLAGPLCTQMLADHGADVIKVEPPFGDESRQLGPPFDANGDAAYYSALNRGKRAMVLDLSKEEGRDALMALLEGADVLVENFLPGTMEKWGLAYEGLLKEKFPRLIYCSISGFGPTGPLGGLPGYDAVLQAMCGLMSINGTPETGPTKIGVPIVDHLTGYTAFSGILLALHSRAVTGEGQHVEAVLFDAALSLLVPQAVNWMHSGVSPVPLGSAHPNIAPYDSFKTQDGSVFLGILNDAQFKRLCHCIQRQDILDNAQFASNASRLQHRDLLHREIEGAFAAWTRDELCAALMKNGVPVGPVNTVPEALRQSHAAHRNMVIEHAEYRGLGIPIKLSATPPVPGSPPPRFGEHDAPIKQQIARHANKKIKE